MEITGIKIRKITDSGRLRGIVSITLDDEFAVHDIKIVKGSSRLFVAMPSRLDENGEWRDIVHPMTSQAREEMEKRILHGFEEECRRSGIIL
jgi:stage V sporulation protein G